MLHGEGRRGGLVERDFAFFNCVGNDCHTIFCYFEHALKVIKYILSMNNSRIPQYFEKTTRFFLHPGGNKYENSDFVGSNQSPLTPTFCFLFSTGRGQKQS